MAMSVIHSLHLLPLSPLSGQIDQNLYYSDHERQRESSQRPGPLLHRAIAMFCIVTSQDDLSSRPCLAARTWRNIWLMANAEISQIKGSTSIRKRIFSPYSTRLVSEAT